MARSQQRDLATTVILDIGTLKNSINEFFATRPASESAAVLAERYQLARGISEAASAVLKPISDMIAALNLQDIPQAFERENLSTITLDSGYRVTLSQLTRASMVAELKDDAMKWLKDNEHEYAVTETVNASTLSALAKELLTQGKELPDNLFKVTILPSVSVTKVKAK